MVATNYVDYVLAALVFYEYFITLSQEIKIIWQGPFNFSAALFVSNRYILVFNAVLSLVIDLTWGNISCNVLQRLNEATIVATYVIIALFAGFWVYFTWERNWLIASSIFALNLIPAITNIVYFIDVHPVPYVVWPVIAQCNIKLTMTSIVSTRIVQATRIPMIIADGLVVGITIYKTMGRKGVWSTWRTYGILYFFVLFALNLCQMIMASTGVSPIAPFIYTLTPIFLSRFMLYLRHKIKTEGPGAFISLVQFPDISMRDPAHDGEEPPRLPDLELDEKTGAGDSGLNIGDIEEVDRVVRPGVTV